MQNKTEELYKQLQQLKAELQAYKDKVKPVNFVDGDEYLKVVVENKQLKAENEKLKQDLQKESDLGHKAICEEMDSFFEVMKLQKVLDEIEEIVENKCNKCKFDKSFCKDCVLQLIKKAKEGK